jgi:LPS O-antigen subunit length determinant protein (WzzB/FepE family)
MLGTNQSNYPNAIYGPSKLNQSNQSNLVKFINELEDYEEFLMVILNTKKIQDHFSKLNTKDQEKELFKIIKLLKIVVPKKNESKYIINFKWHNPEEAKKILQDILNLTSKNIKKRIDLELDQFLELKKKLILAEDRNRLDYLKEQSAIAKELNIADNQVGNVNLSQQNDLSANIAYYLRGYKAIEKEIELTENRDYQNIKLVEEEINSFKAQKVKFADYNLYLMDVESLNNTKLYLIISILLGLIVGIFYVLISNAFQSKKHLKKD